jgi:hypothetical protein
MPSSRRPLQIEGTYNSTRIPFSSQSALNIYPNSARGYRQIPGQNEFCNFLSDTEALNDNTGDQLIDSLAHLLTPWQWRVEPIGARL